MKTLISITVSFVILPAWGGEFVNLTFDSPRLDRVRTEPTGFKYGPVEDVLLGWHLETKPFLQPWQPYTGEVEFGTIAIFKPVALLSGSDLGNYGVWFNSPLPPFPGQPPPPDILLSTTGTVPLNAVSFAWSQFSGIVSFEGDQIYKTAPGPDRSLDVRSMAGKEVTISFFMSSGGFSPLDVVGFKTVPEPQTWALFGVGAAAIFYFARRKN